MIQEGSTVQQGPNYNSLRRSPYPKCPRPLSELFPSHPKCLKALLELSSPPPKCPSNTFGARGLEELLTVFLLNFFLGSSWSSADRTTRRSSEEKRPSKNSSGSSWMELLLDKAIWSKKVDGFLRGFHLQTCYTGEYA